MLEDSLDDEVKKMIEEFVDSFEETKSALMNFLTKYTLEDAVYDKEFTDAFKAIIGALSQRVTYEEKTLYKVLQES